MTIKIKLKQNKEWRLLHKPSKVLYDVVFISKRNAMIYRENGGFPFPSDWKIIRTVVRVI